MVKSKGPKVTKGKRKAGQTVSYLYPFTFANG